MKKITTFWLAILLACSTMMGCQQDNPEDTTDKTEVNQQESTDDKAETAETLPKFEDVIKEYDQDDSQQGFSIKGKRYTYKGNAVMEQWAPNVYPAGEVLLLHVTNETDTNYTATLTITYADESGKIIETEKQSFKQFAAGYQKYFLFTPKSDYASYTCELSLTQYTGEIYVDKISCEFADLERMDYWIEALLMQDDYTKYPSILARFRFNLLPHPEMSISRICIIFDNKEEIYLIRQFGDKIYKATTESTEKYFSFPVYHTTEKELVWPEELTGEINGIVIYDIVG